MKAFELVASIVGGELPLRLGLDAGAGGLQGGRSACRGISLGQERERLS